MSESWAPVEGFEGYYEVSDAGRVRSLTRNVEGVDGRVTRIQGKILKPSRMQTGHMWLALYRDGLPSYRAVYHLVLRAFVGPAPVGAEGCHRNGDPSNNSVANLRWGTRSTNVLDSVEHGTHGMSRRTHCPSNHEYTEENIYRAPSRPNARYCRACIRARGQARRVDHQDRVGKYADEMKEAA